MKDCPFPTDFCPLCQSKSKLVNENEADTSFQCQNVIVDDDSIAYKYHYYVDISKVNNNCRYTQNAIVLPYILYSQGETKTTEIYWYDKSSPMITILTLPQITDWSNPEKLVVRIKKLIPFS